MKHFCILGQSNYAVAIILDTLKALYPGQPLAVDLVANIPETDNDSSAFGYETPGILTREIFHQQWTPVSYAGYLIGSIGKSRRAMQAFFQARHQIQPDQYLTLIHPSSVIPAVVQLGCGIHVSPLTVVAPYASLGDFVVLNRQVSVGHHTRLDDFVTLNPGVNIAGCCHLETGVTVGAGATILDKITVGAGSIIGAGSVVTRAIPAGVVAYGAPAKVIREL